MASPHVAGILAAFVSRPEYTDMKPSELKHLLIKMSTKGSINGLPLKSHTKNRFIFNGVDEESE